MRLKTRKTRLLSSSVRVNQAGKEVNILGDYI